MKIYIPHIHYTLKVKDVSKAKSYVKELLKTKVACFHKEDNFNGCIYIKLPIKNFEVPLLAHEVIHCLQHICETRNIDFVDEKEHMAYLMSWILNEILGYRYK